MRATAMMDVLPAGTVRIIKYIGRQVRLYLAVENQILQRLHSTYLLGASIRTQS